ASRVPGPRRSLSAAAVALDRAGAGRPHPRSRVRTRNILRDDFLSRRLIHAGGHRRNSAPSVGGDVTMASDKPSPFLVEAVKASASRFKETKNALEARQKELDAREAELETRATDLERKAERLKGERDDFQKEKEQGSAPRAT